LLNFQWILAGGGVILALVAFLWARRVTRRIERLSQSYWELRYEQGQLNARVGRLEPSATPAGEQGAENPQRPQTAFVPLSSLRNTK
jgi:hypothetical protein